MEHMVEQLIHWVHRFTLIPRQSSTTLPPMAEQCINGLHKILMYDTNIASNSAAYGGAIRLFKSLSVADSSNIFSCTSITGSASISGNTTGNSQSSAIFITGDDAEVRMKQCKPGGNYGNNSDPDLKMAQGGALSLFSNFTDISDLHPKRSIEWRTVCTWFVRSQWEWFNRME